jgi:hypothetical protein
MGERPGVGWCGRAVQRARPQQRGTALWEVRACLGGRFSVVERIRLGPRWAIRCCWRAGRAGMPVLRRLGRRGAGGPPRPGQPARRRAPQRGCAAGMPRARRRATRRRGDRPDAAATGWRGTPARYHRLRVASCCRVQRPAMAGPLSLHGGPALGCPEAAGWVRSRCAPSPTPRTAWTSWSAIWAARRRHQPVVPTGSAGRRRSRRAGGQHGWRVSGPGLPGRAGAAAPGRPGCRWR